VRRAEEKGFFKADSNNIYPKKFRVLAQNCFLCAVDAN
jgi:hypothetical protein